MSNPKPFWQAIQTGNAEIVEQHIRSDGSLLNARAESGHTPIRMACDCGQRQLAGKLIDLGATLDAFDACAFGDAGKVQLLLAEDFGLISQYSHDGWTLLHLACFGGHMKLASGLLTQGASLDAVSNNPTRNTPLHAALAGGATEALIALLLDFGADPNATGGGGAKPLHLAASRGSQELVDLLIANGALSCQMDDGKSPAAVARERGFAELANRLESEAV